ncbi:hypothetical protein [Prosthecobacter sp.]|jgi:hypothetical protein|uniref:hypothetical protein n=1 Tax=Prosthecobacter sp. TaxID=1965333 RepID=UPI0037C95ED0
MKQDEIQKLAREIESISNHFEEKPWTDNIRPLKDDFDMATIGDPKGYLEFISEANEILRQARVLFIYSVFNRVCEKDGIAYCFKAPYEANMKYSAVMKNDGSFYILDEDGHYRETFYTEKFARFVENEYWEVVEK